MSAAYAYLDHNATSPLRPEAFDAMVEALRAGGNPSAVHGVGRKARGLVDKARREVAARVGALPAEVVFTSGGTEANNMTARLLTEAKVEARRNLLALDAALAKDGALLDAGERAELDQGRARLEAAIAGQDRDEINAAAEALETLSKTFAERRMGRRRISGAMARN